MGNEFLLDEHGCIFHIDNDQLIPFDPNGSLFASGEKEIINKLRSDPYSSFFKTPFYQLAKVVGGRITGRVSLSPGDFYPGSPFDVVHALRSYLFNGELLLPRMYLYPTAKCNCNCTICQFHERHKDGYELSRESMLNALSVLKNHRGGLRTQSLIVSGDGEPMLYPHLSELLDLAKKDSLRVFLTTNLTMSSHSHKHIYEMIAKSVDMLTISIKGLTPSAYGKYQGVANKKLFSQVLKGLELLVTLREKYGRKDEMVIGVASLILPENTYAYIDFIDYLHSIGVDYLYLNQVEPSVERWGIKFSSEQINETLCRIKAYSGNAYEDLMVRCANNPFRQHYVNTLYYDAAFERENTDICGSALFNPLVIAAAEDKMTLTACRNSDNFGNDSFSYDLSEDGNISVRSIEAVMTAAKDCHVCRLERQVKHIDKMISLERQDVGKGIYGLIFDMCKLMTGYYRVIRFDDMLK